MENDIPSPIDLTTTFIDAREWTTEASPDYKAMNAANNDLAANPTITIEPSSLSFSSLLETITPDALVIAGKSYHFGGDGKYMDNYQLHDLNEINPGLSAQWKLAQYDKSQAFLEIGSYKNSQHNQSNYVALGYEHDLLDSKNMGIGIKAGIISGYEDFVPENLVIGDHFIPAFAPYVRLGEDSDIHVDVSLMPAPGEEFEHNGKTYAGSNLVTHATISVPL